MSVLPNRWYYQKGLQTDEAYGELRARAHCWHAPRPRQLTLSMGGPAVFVCYDSRAGRARFTPHTGNFLLLSLPSSMTSQ